jgi:phosphoesterase RecJ-like protein
MHWYLTTRGKSCVVYNYDPLPRKLAFLRNVEVIGVTQPAEKFDVIIVLDCSNPDRLGWKGFAQCAGFSVNLDHHRDNTLFADLNYVDGDAAATAELLHAFFADQGVVYPPAVAEYLYAAIMTDTGGFRFSNTNGRVLRTCAELAERGVDCAGVYRQAYDSHTPAGLMLWSRIIATLSFHCDGKVCMLELPLRLVGELGAVYSDSEGIADFTVLATGVEVGVFVKHTERETHFSLRSRGTVDVGRIAQRIPGGGGHGSAAGCTIPLPFARAAPVMLETIRAELG